MTGTGCLAARLRWKVRVRRMLCCVCKKEGWLVGSAQTLVGQAIWVPICYVRYDQR